MGMGENREGLDGPNGLEQLKESRSGNAVRTSSPECRMQSE